MVVSGAVTVAGGAVVGAGGAAIVAGLGVGSVTDAIEAVADGAGGTEADFGFVAFRRQPRTTFALPSLRTILENDSEPSLQCRTDLG